MATENRTGIQTRAMTEAQHLEIEAQKQLGNNPEQIQDANPIAATEQGTINPALKIQQ